MVFHGNTPAPLNWRFVISRHGCGPTIFSKSLARFSHQLFNLWKTIVELAKIKLDIA
jgi:hypothetical protein